VGKNSLKKWVIYLKIDYIIVPNPLRPSAIGLAFRRAGRAKWSHQIKTLPNLPFDLALGL
jgi:hypothetical protein